MCLSRLSTFNKVFLNQAFAITGCKQEAGDLLQDLYIKLHEKYTPKINSLSDTELKNYVFTALRNTHYSNKTKKKLSTISIDDERFVGNITKHIEDKPSGYDLSDLEKEMVKELTFTEKEVLTKRNEKESLRQISKQTNTSYFHIFDIERKAKRKVLNKMAEIILIENVKKRVSERIKTFPNWYSLECGAKEMIDTVIVETKKQLENGESRS